jgi:hypothetical protein
MIGSYTSTTAPHMTKSVIALIAVLALLSISGCGPRDYDECVLKAMKGVTSDFAARAIVKSCRDKFPGRKQQDAQLPAEALLRLAGHGQVKDGSFSGNIYNGNSDWTVTQVTIKLTPYSPPNDPFDALLATREYNADVNAAPLTNRRLYFSVDAPLADYSWSISRARGYRTR